MTALVQIVTAWPDSQLNPNNRLGKHWAATHAAKVAALNEAWALSRKWAGVLPPDVSLVAEIRLEPPDDRRRDVDNVLAALKPTLDGLAKGIGYDDSRVRQYVISRDEPCRPDGRVTISIRLDLRF